MNLLEALGMEWSNLVKDFGEGAPISIPRSYFHCVGEYPTSVMLCGFCDASTYAYAAVVYLVIRTDVSSSTQFVASKTIVPPYGCRPYHT